MTSLNNQNYPASNANSSQVSAFSEFSMGSLLLRMGKITAEDVERIAQFQKEREIRFGEAAISLGLINETDIAEVLARQFDYPYMLSSEDINSELIAAYQPFSHKAEILRGVRSQLMMHWFSPERKSLVVSAVDSDHGVSHFIANLGVVFAQLGEKTLLIDANLRQPRLHKIFNSNEKRGLADILAGRVGFDVVEKIGFFDNLSLLNAGTIPPNPQELISKPIFNKLLSHYSTEYDVILIDTPSFSSGADVQTIAANSGGIFIVVKKNHSRINDLENIAEQLRNNGTPVVGSVLTEF
ncbi:chain length determinant protein tyrosine kinase EpsG [Methylobacillus methanolivorans]|uniref:Chain length determinant protein tyrosine kinase EpsG n=1 Tax=Methylobacillus methanolivorans TaxID=1848927 RepID=A0ABW8GH29_9PROT